MELRVLQYFLTVAREQSISAAAQALHLSQPTLSRQLKEMEEELGKTLFLRGNRKITLTEEGMILRKRAQEVMELLEKAQEEIACSTEIIAGNIHIGAGETEGIRPLIQAAHSLQKQYPLVHFHVVSGDKTTVLEELDHGLIDFALIFGEIDTSRYDFLPLPTVDAFGVLMPKDAPLAQKAVIAPQDLLPYPLITSRQMLRDDHLAHIFGNDAKISPLLALITCCSMAPSWWKKAWDTPSVLTISFTLARTVLFVSALFPCRFRRKCS